MAYRLLTSEVRIFLTRCQSIIYKYRTRGHGDTETRRHGDTETNLRSESYGWQVVAAGRATGFRVLVHSARNDVGGGFPRIEFSQPVETCHARGVITTSPLY